MLSLHGQCQYPIEHVLSEVGVSESLKRDTGFIGHTLIYQVHLNQEYLPCEPSLFLVYINIFRFFSQINGMC